MKRIFLVVFILFYLKAAAQDVIYLTDGTSVPGKITEITVKKTKFINLTNPTGPVYSRENSEIHFVVNAVGDYLVYRMAKPFTDQERDEFISPAAKTRSVDIVVDADGKLMPIIITNENDAEISFTDKDGKSNKLSKSSLTFLIRRNGTHELYVNSEQAEPYFVYNKQKINKLISAPAPVLPASLSSAEKPGSAVSTADTSSASNGQQTTIASTSKIFLESDTKVTPILANKPAPKAPDYIAPDMASYGIKAINKAKEFTDYLHIIASSKSDLDVAYKSISQACDLFLNQGVESRVEVSSIYASATKRYKVHDYLGRLLVKAGQFDKVNVEYANINYASEFKKGLDGNYYGTVTFVQKFQGFMDGNLVYGDKTKRSIIIVLKHFEKQVNGAQVSGWDIYLDDIGVVETKKI